MSPFSPLKGRWTPLHHHTMTTYPSTSADRTKAQ
jgi:hypothetical protein